MYTAIIFSLGNLSIVTLPLGEIFRDHTRNLSTIQFWKRSENDCIVSRTQHLQYNGMHDITANYTQNNNVSYVKHHYGAPAPIDVKTNIRTKGIWLSAGTENNYTFEQKPFDK